MGKESKNKKLQDELAALIASAFPDMTVEVGHSARWDRDCVTFRSSGFAGLLPEERFHRLARAIPEDFRGSKLKGFVWLELTPKETIDAYLKLPRSEDIVNKEAAIYRELVAGGFFESLRKQMGSKPDASCQGGFSDSEAVMSTGGKSAVKIRNAKLLFIRHGVYCDCQVLNTVEPELQELFAGAA